MAEFCINLVIILLSIFFIGLFYDDDRKDKHNN